jgi:hypothetical protein
MRGLYVELRSVAGVNYIPQNIASYLRARLAYGRISVVANQPHDMLRSTQEEWRKLTPSHAFTFDAQPPSKDPQVDIHFSTARAYRQIPPICRTLYVTCEVSRQDMYLITSWMPPQSLVVIYRV